VDESALYLRFERSCAPALAEIGRRSPLETEPQGGADPALVAGAPSSVTATGLAGTGRLVALIDARVSRR